MVKKKKRGLTIKINLTNRWLYTLIAIGIIAMFGVGVWAVAPNPGHTADEIEGVCQSDGTGCPPLGDSDWAISGSNVYRSSGNVGIGTSSPLSKLHISGGSLRFDPTNFEGAGQIQSSGTIKFANGDHAQGIYVKQISVSDSWVDNDANTQENGLYVKGKSYLKDDVGIGVEPIKTAKLLVSPSTSYNQGIRVDGPSSQYGISAAGTYAGIQGYGYQYDFLASGPGQDYGSISSIRWKKNIQPIDSALDKVLNIRGVYFDWDKEHGGEHDMGFIAEEVGEYIPEIVSYEENGIYATGLDYGAITPVLVEAIKELKAENDALKARVEFLENN